MTSGDEHTNYAIKLVLIRATKLAVLPKLTSVKQFLERANIVLSSSTSLIDTALNMNISIIPFKLASSKYQNENS